MKDKARVCIVCCNRLLQESVARILAKKNDFEICATTAPGSTSWEEIIDAGADVLVLDSLSFLLKNSASSLTARTPREAPRCVMIAMEDDPNNFLVAVRRGARGYVLQEASAMDVVQAIRVVAEGHAVCPAQYTEVLFECVAAQSAELPNSEKRAKWGLTRREQQLIPMIGKGLSNKEIANHLNLSEQTVKNHIHRILRKTGVSDRLSVLEVCQAIPPSTHRKEYPAG